MAFLALSGTELPKLGAGPKAVATLKTLSAGGESARRLGEAEISDATEESESEKKEAKKEGEVEKKEKEAAETGETEEEKEEKEEEEELEKEAEDGEEEEEEEEEEEHFTHADIQVACVVLGAVAIDVSLFDLVNWTDDDIRLYTWSILSMTISIFVAVLGFGAINQYVELLAEGMNEWLGVALAFAQCAFYLVFMLFWIGYESGMICEPGEVNLDEEVWTVADSNRAEHGRLLTADEIATLNSIDQKRGTYEDENGNRTPVMKRKMVLEQRLRRMKCYAGLLSHMAGFAAINAGGQLQHTDLFNSHPLLCLIPTLITCALCQLVFLVSGHFRKMQYEAAKALGRAGRRAKLCSEFIEEGENDVMSLSLSFLAVQSVKFGLSGLLPNVEGVEEPEERQPWPAVCGLYLSSLLFAAISSVLAIGMVKRREQPETRETAPTSTQPLRKTRTRNSWMEEASLDFQKTTEEPVEENAETLMDRVWSTLMSTAAMSFAWCVLFATRWVCVNVTFVDLESMFGMIQLALILSLFAGVSVFLFDVADDFFKNHGNSEAGSLAVSTIINALALLVGFTWEKCFDHGVKAISARAGHARLNKLVLAAVVAVLVVRPWRRYILTKVMYLELMKKSTLKQRFNNEAARSGYSSVPSLEPSPRDESKK